jgi:hypothetical protein
MRIEKTKMQAKRLVSAGTPVEMAYFQPCFIYDKFLACLEIRLGLL